MTTEPTVDIGIVGLVQAVEVGRRDFWTVYRAYQPAFERFVAVKVFGEQALDDFTKAVFERECNAIGRISGRANILSVHEAGANRPNGPAFMAYISGDASRIAFKRRVRCRGGRLLTSLWYWPEP